MTCAVVVAKQLDLKVVAVFQCERLINALKKTSYT